MARLGSAITTAIVIFVGFVTLLGLVVTSDLSPVFDSVLNNPLFSARGLAGIFIQLTVITIAVTILIGILNLLLVHLGRLFRRQIRFTERLYSLVLLVSALGVLVLTGLERSGSAPAGSSSFLLNNVQVAIESALAGLVLFALVYGAYRMLRHRVTFAGVLFTLALLVFLLLALPFRWALGLAEVRDWLLAVPVSAGARGILLGIALATAVTGVRVLIGQDRSYRE